MKNKLLSQLYESCKKWKTLVLLGAMLLIGINQMWGAWYIQGTGGNLNAWGNGVQMTQGTYNTSVYYRQVSGYCEFKITSEQNGYNDEKNGNKKDNSLGDVTLSGDNNISGNGGSTWYICYTTASDKVYGTTSNPDTPPSYTVSYNANGGSGSTSSHTDVEYNSSITLKDCGFTYSGYHFTGWNTDADGNGTAYAARASYTVTANVTLYAQWRKTIYVDNAVSWGTLKIYTYNKEKNGGWSGNTTGITRLGSSSWYQVDIKSGAAGFILNNGSDGNDNKTADLTTSEFADGGSYYINNSTSPRGLTPKTFTVTVYMHDHGGDPGYAGSYYYNALITEEDEPSASGYTFEGWFTEAGYENEWNFATDHVTSNVDLHAKWTADAPTEYTLTYGVANSPYNNGSLSEVTVGGVDASSGESYTSGSKVSLTANPNSHYHVKGWYSDNSCSSAIAGAGTDNPYVFDLDDNTTVYVGFEINKTTITLDANGGAADREVVATYGSSFPSFSAITRTGYTLNGYFTASSGGTKIINADGTLVASTSYSDASSNWNSDATTLTLHAQWTARTYTVNFDQQSGSGGSTSVTATFGSAMPDATMPTRSGYDFGGYFTLTGGNGTKYYNANGTSAGSWDIDTNNTTLYAYWVPEATWYLIGDEFDDGYHKWEASNDDYPFDQNYRGISRVYYREVTSIYSNERYFRVHNGTKIYGNPGNSNMQVLLDNEDPYSIITDAQYGSFYRVISEGTVVWFVINTNNDKIWIMSPLHDIDVTENEDKGTVTMTATDAKTSESVTGTQFASGETVTIVVTPESGYQISSVTFDGDPIDADSEDGYAKTYSVTMPSSDAELEVVYEEIPPEWKMYNGATLLGTFTGSGPYTAIINHTAGNSSNQYFELNGTAYQLAADCQLTSEQTLSTGSTQHAWTTDDYGYYRVSISTPDEGSTWKVQATRVYAVTYDGNGNTSGTAPATQYYAVGETIITATKGDLVYTNLHFYGWNTANDGSGSHYAESASAGTMTSSGLNLYAEWEDLSSSWVLKGGTNVTGDNWETEHMLLKKPGHTDEKVVYYTASISSTNAGNNKSNAYSFKIVKKGDSDTWYGLGSGDGEWWYYRSSGEQTMGTSNKNIQIIADMAGDYEVKVDYTDVSNPKVTVSFPIDGNYNVTLSAGSHGSVANEGTLTIHEFPKVAISATPEPGYRFTGWTVDDDHSSYINFDNSSNASTNVWATDAAAAGATITANFSNDGFVYLDKSAIKDEWGGTPYVYFYSSSYWDSSDAKRGSGSKTGGGVTVYGPYAMTRIGDSQIWYYDYHTTPGTGTTKNYIAFNDHSQAGYDNFVACLAIYRGDFYQKQNMFVVKDYKYYYNTGAKEGQAVYYNDGYWRKYNDIDPGYVVKIYNDWSSSGKANLLGTYAFSSLVAGSASAEATVSLNAGTNYFKVVGCDTTTINGVDYAGTYYRDSRNGTMDTDNSDNWPLTDEGGSNTGVLATASGDYNFRLTLGNGTLYISVDFPLNVGDYRLVYNGKMQTTADSKKDHPSNYIRRLKQPTIASDTIRTDTISFFVDPSTADDDLTPEIRFQWCSGFSGYNALWRDTLPSAKIDLSGITEVGIYNFVITQTNTKTASTHAISGVKSAEPYTGNFYVRTNEAKGGWKSYANVIDNRMTYSDYSKSHSGYDYYNCHYIGTEKNVKFTIANDYNECITDTLYGDDFVDAGTQELPYQANVRFMYNSETNVIGRAYLNGSSDGATEYLKIASNPGRTSATSATKSERAEIVDKNGAIMLNNDTTFEDLGNWVYQIDLKALEGGRVKLTSDYRYGGVSHNQWFKGKDGDWSDANTEQIMGGDANEYHLLRVIYDFKTNHMLSAWLVDQNENITTTRSVNADVLILRTGHEDAKQITFGTGAELDDVDTIYSAIELRKSHILGSGSQASKEFYWVSFPYDVKISDIFGSVGNFNIDWAIQYYNGKKRAQNGFWSDSEPNWEFFMSNTETLKANEGYVLTLALRKFLKTGTGSKWDNGVDSLYLYFPSANKIGTILKKDTILKIDTVGYQCTIDRRTDKATPNIDKDRRVADSHWHCIGIPSFANSTRSTGSSWTTSEGENSSITDEDDIPNIEQWTSPSLLFLYSWDMTTNKLTPVTTSTYTFKAMHAYLVQYANDTIHWKAVSRPSKIVARQRMAVQSQEFRLEVRKNNVVEDQTFIHFSDEEGVTAGFEFGRDLSKEFNNNSANIYTFADYVPVAGNSMPLETEQTTVVPMGVKVAANGEYTIAMPEGTNGIGVVLVDNVAGTRTNLGLEDYTINLSAGQYNGRFVLEVSPIMHTPTGIEEVAGEGAQGIGARKVLIDGVMYIVRDGKIFDARGNRVK